MGTGPEYPIWEAGSRQKYRRKKIANFMKNLAVIVCMAAFLIIIAYALSHTVSGLDQYMGPIRRLFD
jgi:hypothetical protein